MALTSEQASQALRDLEAVSQRSGKLYRYQRTAPMLILWGVIWIVGFGATQLAPARAGWLWIVLDIAGVLGCIYLGRRGHADASASQSWRWLGTIAAIGAFYVLALTILQPTSGAQVAAFIGLLVAMFYVLAGLWIGVRLAIIGLALAVLTVFGYYMLPAYFALWMAVVGGGALILAGLWLRTA
ncbi:hypothetical protein [Paraburkholderia sp. DHOC27]|uniref:hypothetical protein n=1 Tax=Paraburkholderia sp. DHOC27 TaxID=2303330 RepID=UPI000E3B8AB6|nr:hypothetical protein [Paraburkholderia sp. DHOC27]RFU48590.1 hypothetical protein D0B32_01765 [Paraburkholderia sp. DHOC27]